MNGIGGSTIREAQENMEYSEFLQWVAYRNVRGPLNLALRIDRAAALVAAPTYRTEMGKLMPFHDSNKEDKKSLNIVEDKNAFNEIAKDKKYAGEQKERTKKIAIKKTNMLKLEERAERLKNFMGEK